MPFPDAATTTGDAAVLGKMYGRDGTFNKLYNQQMAYVAQGRGLMPVLDVATFIGSENAPGTTAASLFAPVRAQRRPMGDGGAGDARTYVVPITVHSAGLCYWPTATTTYNITATSIPTVDLVGQICTKFRAAGIAVVPYWSIWQGNKLLSSPTQAQYRTFLESQFTELFALYGPFPGIWCDGGLWHFGSYYPWTNAADMKNFIHSIQPSCIVINNTHAGNLEDSDLVEYEGGGVPLGNTLPAEGVKSILNDGNWFWKPAAQPQPLAARLLAEPGHAGERPHRRLAGGFRQRHHRQHPVRSNDDPHLNRGFLKWQPLLGWRHGQRGRDTAHWSTRLTALAARRCPVTADAVISMPLRAAARSRSTSISRVSRSRWARSPGRWTTASTTTTSPVRDHRVLDHRHRRANPQDG
jgi:hypothetical protein